MNQTPHEVLTSALERVLRDLCRQYEELHALALAHRDAIRRADPRAISSCVTEQNVRVQRVVELEKRRLVVVGEMAALLGCETKNQTPVGALVKKLPAELGGRLEQAARSLRGAMEAMTRANEPTRRAAEALASHMDGLLRVVAAALNHAQTYSRRGVIGPGPRVMTALDSVA